MPKEKLIEVALPLDAINDRSARSRGLPDPILAALRAAEHPVGVVGVAISRRRSLLGSRSERADDAPFVKTLLLLLCSRLFEGSVLGARERGELSAWTEILTVALDEQFRQRRSEGTGTIDG